MDRAQPAPHHPEGSRNALNFQFSPEELKVLQECNREAFFQRSMPLGTVFGLGTYYAVQRGFLKSSPRFGAGPKVFVGITLGYFIGKLSYQSRCAEKIMRIPNSRLADMIRQRRQGATTVERLYPDQGFGAGAMLSPFGPASPSDSVTEQHFRNRDSINIDVHTPNYSGLDESARPSLDSNRAFEEDLQLPVDPPPVTKSYEELRRQNREEYVRRQQAPYRPPTVLEDTPPIRREVAAPSPRPEDHLPQQPQVKNKYGDVYQE
ncbi:AAEL001573-PA [Aedes aegypti]|uniref:AAEL001573-PA n=2 Tax=Aedes aegypti TaxID=7159 RepID=A0A1S4EZ58_AEDAE|nr:OCIA domain-containing protein 1 [Aedes aegypti]EAT47303.1 AAEL001573-PA [Aedes aegypti]